MSTQMSLVLLCPLRDDMASSSTFTLEDSAICLTSEQSTMDVDMDPDDGSVLDIYLVSAHPLAVSRMAPYSLFKALPKVVVHFIGNKVLFRTQVLHFYVIDNAV